MGDGLSMRVENETYGSLRGNIRKFQKIGVDREYNITVPQTLGY